MTEASFIFLPPDSGCYRYIATVKPVNVVGNGSLSTVELSQNCEDEVMMHGHPALLSVDKQNFCSNYKSINQVPPPFPPNFLARGSTTDMIYISYTY